MVRPFVMTPKPFVMRPDDLPPEGAAPPVLDGCDGCVALAVVVFWRVVLFLPKGWKEALPTVVELHLCGHHARIAEPVLRGWTAGDEVGAWSVALDAR